MKSTLLSLSITMMLCGSLMAQEPLLPPGGPGELPPGNMVYTRAVRSGEGPGQEKVFVTVRRAGEEPMGPPPGMEGAWWKDPQIVQKLKLTDDQISKLKTNSQDHRLQAIDLRADVEKQQAILGFQMDTDLPDEAKILAQIDKLTQARSRLEKSNVQSMLAERRVLTPEQAKMLRELLPLPPPGPHVFMRHMGGPPPAFGPPGEMSESPRGGLPD